MFRASAALVFAAASSFAASSFIGDMKTIKAHASTIPSNGDVNPYGVAVVPSGVGQLRAGSVLVSNFNDSANTQGTGITIVQISPGDGSTKLFAQISAPGCPGGVGLTTALVALRSGWVIVGSLPTDPTSGALTGPGCLIVLNSSGKVVETFADSNINGPWDMTALDMGTAAVLFVTNVLKNISSTAQPNGYVLRVVLSIPLGGMPSISSETVIGSGFNIRTDTAALVIGPTGLGLGADGTLYVADTLGNQIVPIANALTSPTMGTPFTTTGLNGPLGLAIAPNGNIVVVNSLDGNMVEVTPGGTQVAIKSVDVTGVGAGDLFGLAIRDGHGVYFVNDGNNTLDLLH
jgi:hypothetical protein